MSVLVVDDEWAIRELVVELLTEVGYAVDTASNGEAALALLEQCTVLPRLILLDLMMPVMDGWRFGRALGAHATWNTIPIVVVSAGGNLAGAMRDIGAVAALRKPIDLERLLAVVRTYSG